MFCPTPISNTPRSARWALPFPLVVHHGVIPLPPCREGLLFTYMVPHRWALRLLQTGNTARSAVALQPISHKEGRREADTVRPGSAFYTLGNFLGELLRLCSLASAPTED